MTILIGRWDCKRCGQTGIHGPDTRCPSCGAPRPDDVQFYLPDEAEEVRDQARLDEARAGADWVCSYCETSNKARHTVCVSCGAARQVGAPDDRLLAQKVEMFDAPPPASSPKVPRPFYRQKRYYALGVLLLLAFTVWMFTWTKQVEVTVMEHRWACDATLQHYRQLSLEDFEPPADAQIQRQFEAVHHHEKRKVGTRTATRQVKEKTGEERYACGRKDLGNGYFETVYCTRPVYTYRTETYEEPVYQSFPIYRTKYAYTIWRWVNAEKLNTSGRGLQPAWPSPAALHDTAHYRLGDSTLVLTLVLRDAEGNQYLKTVEERIWRDKKDGQALHGKVSILLQNFEEFTD